MSSTGDAGNLHATVRLATDNVRFIGRVLTERPGLTFAQADALLDGLAELDGVAADVARSRVALALNAAGLDLAAKYVASGADLASTQDTAREEEA